MLKSENSTEVTNLDLRSTDLNDAELNADVT